MVILKEIDSQKDVLHLVKVWHVYDNEVIVTAPPELERLAKKLEAMDNPTSNEALSLIWRECGPYLDVIGYADDRFKRRRNIIFSKNKPSGDCGEKIDFSKYENLTTLTPDAATVRDGKIVSAARAFLCLDGAYEISVETAPAYRGKGYATDNVTELSDRLIREGKSVRYLCSEKNEASKKVALGAGFFEIGKNYDYIVRRKDIKNGI